jgi:2-polyprenyl-3-methyl-5-hydroxy-6-metoxy-1,4-benzoquinol methylase
LSVYIPARERVPKTHAGDPIDYYYRPITGPIYRKRLAMVVQLLRGKHFTDLLEVGFGSGILLPELARHADRVAGLDIHDQTESVREMLAQESVSAQLHEGDLFKMPFPDGAFDCLICVSVLEHLRDLDAALSEFARVTRPDATVVLGVPVRNPATDAFFRLAGYKPREVHPSSHSDVEAAALRNDRLRMERRLTYPGWLPVRVSLYFAFRCLRVGASSGAT